MVWMKLFAGLALALALGWAAPASAQDAGASAAAAASAPARPVLPGITMVTIAKEHRTKEPLQVSLRDRLVVHVNDQAAAALRTMATQTGRPISLVLNGLVMKDIEANDLGNNQLVFFLDRTPDNRDQWTQLLEAQFWDPQLMDVAVGVDGASPIRVGGAGQGHVLFKLFKNPWKVAVGLLAVALYLFSGYYFSKNSALVRDLGTPIAGGEKDWRDYGTFSLARMQMAWWTDCIFLGMAFIYAVSGDYDTLTPQMLALMGISSATTLGAALIDLNVSGDSLAKAKQKSLNSQASNNARLAEIATQLQETDPAKLTPVQREELTQERKELLAKNAAIADDLELISNGQYPRKQRSQGPFRDMFYDSSGLSLHRLQMALWTVGLSAVYFYEVFSSLSEPSFSATSLAAMGISAATYLGFKIPEPSPATPATGSVDPTVEPPPPSMDPTQAYTAPAPAYAAPQTPVAQAPIAMDPTLAAPPPPVDPAQPVYATPPPTPPGEGVVPGA